MNTQSASLAFGIVFVLVGILGFVPNPLVAPHGVFAVNLAHNLVHIGTGACSWQLPCDSPTKQIW